VLLPLLLSQASIVVQGFVLPWARRPDVALPSSHRSSSSRCPSLSLSSSPVVPLLRMSAAAPAGAPDGPAVTRSIVQLPTGLAMEVLTAGPVAAGASPSSTTTTTTSSSSPLDSLLAGLFGQAAAAKGRPPLVFVHGSFHSAWCWAEHFMPFFAAQVNLILPSISIRPTKKPHTIPAT